MFRVTDRTGIHSPDEVAAAELTVRLHPTGARAKGWGYEDGDVDAVLWLEEHVSPGSVVADIGTGTGILAIVAALLGGTVTAYEYNPEVAAIARANFELNNLAISLPPGVFERADGRFDLVVANLGGIDYDSLGILAAGVEVWTSG